VTSDLLTKSLVMSVWKEKSF